jgi:hypothetical protein
MPDIKTPQPKSRTAPKVLITVSVAVILLGIGRCGFLAPAIKGTYDDYGIFGAFFIVTGLILLVSGIAWLNHRRTE